MLTSWVWCGFWEGLFALLTSETLFFPSMDGKSWRQGEVRRKSSLRSLVGGWWCHWLRNGAAVPGGWGGQQERGCRRALIGSASPGSGDKLDSLKPMFCFTLHLPAPFTSPSAAFALCSCMLPSFSVQAQLQEKFRHSSVHWRNRIYLFWTSWHRHIHMLLDIHFYQLF